MRQQELLVSGPLRLGGLSGKGWVGYLGRVGWVRGKLMGRGGIVCKRQILQISVIVGEKSE